MKSDSTISQVMIGNLVEHKSSSRAMSAGCLYSDCNIKYDSPIKCVEIILL